MGSADLSLGSGLGSDPLGEAGLLLTSELTWDEPSEAPSSGSQLKMQGPRSQGQGLGSTSWPSVSSSLKWDFTFYIYILQACWKDPLGQLLCDSEALNKSCCFHHVVKTNQNHC